MLMRALLSSIYRGRTVSEVKQCAMIGSRRRDTIALLLLVKLLFRQQSILAMTVESATLSNSSNKSKHKHVSMRGRPKRSVEGEIVSTNGTENALALTSQSKEQRRVLMRLGTSGNQSKKSRPRKQGRRCRCDQFHEPHVAPWWQRQRRVDLKTAYRMAVMSAVAYWDFSKEPLNARNVTGFSLLCDAADGKISRRVRNNLCRVQSGLQYLRHEHLRHSKLFHRPSRNERESRDVKPKNTSCYQKGLIKDGEGTLYRFHYWFRDWHETTKIPKVKWHDTDLLISTSGDNILVVTFTGTQSNADHFTNVQTFEPVSHSKLFTTRNNQTIEGSLHRGILNAYSRVAKGSVIRMCQDCRSGLMEKTLHRRYDQCVHATDNHSRTKKRDNSTAEQFAGDDIHDSADDQEEGSDECQLAGTQLRDILREVVNEALLNGRTVHVTGHSLGGALATMLALDIIINFPDVPLSKFYVWTFGAPQVTDEAFVRSATDGSPRLRSFLRNDGRFNRFVTLTDNCKEDFVSNVASRALPSHFDNLHGRWAQRLGGVRGSISHIARPYYLFPPDNFTGLLKNAQETQGGSIATTLDVHNVKHYLRGISRELPHPLQLRSNLPSEVSQWIGELIPEGKNSVQ